MRDDFTARQKEALGRRAGLICSNPGCKAPTSGPQEHPEKATSVGVAAHITAASSGGPRYDPSLSTSARRSLDNAIWLCQTCGKLVDNDPIRYQAKQLREWKLAAERAALKRLLTRAMPGRGLTEEAIRASEPGELSFSEIEIRFADTLKAFRIWIKESIRARLIRVEEDPDREASLYHSGKPGSLEFPIAVTCHKAGASFIKRFDLVATWLHPIALKASSRRTGIPWDTWLFPIKDNDGNEKHLRTGAIDMRDILYGVLFVSKRAPLPNKAMHPTVSGVTPLANGSKRRAARPAGDGRRLAARESCHLINHGGFYEG